ncbi:DUF1127 domain-containing protein [Pseudaminobacter soli (ex Li et al. 2025)]|uniref:DUF1127 domain-containing protein n=1 Tax=Pseudaminobacter soli (ex Li et al. 2025) TaxID=1295366 RepID=A0A2P7SCE8_9HYPH|nr:DUF1127 domain-containing protein [Mesorhizobium soli]PSJ60192.1 DUF1127 domain-containing protein [Mesorhizobium soli]
MTTEKDIFETTRAANAGDTLRSALIALGNWYDRWQQREHLADLDDHILRDIGISPREVERECAKPFWRR